MFARRFYGRLAAQRMGLRYVPHRHTAVTSCIGSGLCRISLNETHMVRTDGLIVSDQDSIRDAWAGQTSLPGHFYGKSFANVTAMGIKAGCDQNDGHTYSQNGMAAVQQGLLTEHDVRQSVITRMHADLLCCATY